MFVSDYKEKLVACQEKNDLAGMTKILIDFCESASRYYKPKNTSTEELVVEFLDGGSLSLQRLTNYFGLNGTKAALFSREMLRHFGDYRKKKFKVTRHL